MISALCGHLCLFVRGLHCYCSHDSEVLHVVAAGLYYSSSHDSEVLYVVVAGLHIILE